MKKFLMNVENQRDEIKELEKGIDVAKILKEKSPTAHKFLPTFVINYLKKIIHEDELNEMYKEGQNFYGTDFMKELIKFFNINIQTKGLDEIPNDGRYIFVSNHPLGGLDGICIASLIGEKFNNNIKYIVNEILFNLVNLREIFLPVNKYKLQSKETIKLLDETYSSNTQIITFPAGLCSRKIDGKVQDLKWHKSFLQKSIKYKRDIVPIYFEATNSNFFYRFANIRKRLGIKFNIEMLYLSDEMFKQKNKTFRIYFGKPISYKSFDSSKNHAEWTDFIRNKVYALGQKN